MKWPDFPKLVNRSLAVIGGAVLIFLVLLFTLGDARDTADGDVIRLKNEHDQTRKALNQSKADYDFILANREHFDALLGGDKLVPHTRRTAVRQMQALGLEFGMSTLKYSFGSSAPSQSAQAVKSQPQSGLYRVNVETVVVEMGAPLDQSVYSYLAAVHDDFPGTMVLSNFVIEREPRVSQEALNAVSRGQESGLVKIKANFSWKTAQQNQEPKAGRKNELDTTRSNCFRSPDLAADTGLWSGYCSVRASNIRSTKVGCA